MSRVVRVGDDPAAAAAEAARTIRAGGVVVYPTETLYGIGADACDAAAVRKVAAAKRRPEGKPILVVVGSPDGVVPLVTHIPAAAREFMQAFWPGPLTIVFAAAPGLPAELTAGTGTVGVRVPSGTFCPPFLAACGVAVTSTSANLAGEPPPRTLEAIRAALGPGVDLFVDAGTLPLSLPSTVVSVAGPVPRVLREGAIPVDRLRAVIPSITIG